MKKTLILSALSTVSLFSADHKTYGIVLAGGGGKRLWPLSRQERPKQFIKLAEDKTLLECTIERIATLVEKKRIFVVTTKDYEKSVKECAADSIKKVIVEPSSRNTGPAILHTVMQIAQKNPESVLFFVPADHHISEPTIFQQHLKRAIRHAMYHDDIVLLGVKPRRPATEYGYIELGKQIKNQIHSVKRFHEKPKKGIAQNYVKDENFLWNVGIFCAKARVFLNAFASQAPELSQAYKKFQNGECSYNDLPDISFDVAVLEKSQRCVVVPCDFKWSDVGNIIQFITARHEKEKSPEVVAYQANNNMVEGTKKLTVLLNVHDLCVLETPDVLLIAPVNDTDKVKDVLEFLKEQGYHQYL